MDHGSLATDAFKMAAERGFGKLSYRALLRSSRLNRVSYVRSSARSGVFGKLLGGSAHARIAEMECSEVRPCRENENILKLVVN